MFGLDTIHVYRSLGRIVAIVRPLLLATTLITGWSMAGTRPSLARDSVTFDLSKAHAFGGFGVQIWGLPQNFDDLIDLLKELRIRQVRIGSFPTPAQAALTDDSSVQSLVQAIRSAATSSQISRWSSLGQQLRGMNINVHLVIWQAPLPWRRDKPWTDAQGHAQVGHFADPAHTGSYAAYVCAQIIFARSLGLLVGTVELGNEPNGSWGTRWEPRDYAQLVTVSRQLLNEAGLSHVGIEGPGTSTERDAGPYLSALKETGAFKSMAAISVHDWDTRSSSDPVGLTPQFQAEAQSVSRALPVHVTEVNDEAARWKIAAKVGTGRMRFATDSRTFALALTQEVLKGIGDGATESIIWEAEDLKWEKAYLGLLDKNGTPRATVLAFKTFFPATMGASRVVAGYPSRQDVTIAAFLQNRRLVVVAVNVGAPAQDFSVNMLNAPVTVAHLLSAVCYFADAQIPPAACMQLVRINGGTAELSLPGASIVTATLGVESTDR
jgi:hypothetical protein